MTYTVKIKLLLILFFTLISEISFSKPLEEILQNYSKKTVVIPVRYHTNDTYLDFLSSASKGNIDYDLFDDLTEDNQIFLEKKLDLKKRHTFLTKKWNESEVNLLIKIQNTQNHIVKMQEIAEILLIEKIKELRNEFKNDTEKIIEDMKRLCVRNTNTFFLFVFPEAYFNYMHNISRLGNFIPYKNEEKIKWINVVKKFTEENKNSLVVGNLIHIGNIEKINNYRENFLEFIVHSYNQKSILENYYKYDELNIRPIFNQSFVFNNGEQLFSHYKRFILDEDLPLIKLESILDLTLEDRLIYVPGLGNQEKHEDFYIEICQDHAMAKDKNEKAKIKIIQSATLSISEPLLNKLSGLFIHSDINYSECEVLYKKTQNGKFFKLRELKDNIKRLERAGADVAHSEYLCQYYLKRVEFPNFLFYDVSSII